MSEQPPPPPSGPPPSGPPPSGPPPPGPPPGGGGPERGTARLGSTEFSWPVPDKQVTVSGRAMSVELLVVGVVYALGALWLAISLLETLEFLPDGLAGIFASNPFEFGFSWLFLTIIAMLWYVVVALGVVAFRVLRADPLGRGLSAVVSGVLLAAALSDSSSGSFWFVTLLSLACTAVLYLSPWARRALAASPRRHDRPEGVVLSEAVTVSFFSVIGLVALLLLPGLRFIGDLGVEFLLAEVFLVGATVTAFLGVRQIQTNRVRGRLLVTIAAAAMALGLMLAADGSSLLVGIAIGAAIIVPLWAPASSRTYFESA